MTAYVTELWRLRHFWMALVQNDLRNRYRRSLLGLGWSLLQPIAMTVVLCTVFAGVFGVTLKEYAPYLLSGLTFWGFISTAAISGCQSFFQPARRGRREGGRAASRRRSGRRCRASST